MQMYVVVHVKKTDTIPSNTLCHLGESACRVLQLVQP